MAEEPTGEHRQQTTESTIETGSIGLNEQWAANLKALFDTALAHLQNTNSFTAQAMEEYNTNAKNMNTVSLQAVQNAVENANIRL